MNPHQKVNNESATGVGLQASLSLFFFLFLLICAYVNWPIKNFQKWSSKYLMRVIKEANNVPQPGNNLYQEQTALRRPITQIHHNKVL